MTTDQCPFCSPAPERIFYQDSLVIGIWDIFPVNPGHALLITRRHVRDWFEASHEERMALTRAVEVARFAIAGSFQADGYNIGINVGEAAGQTVFHLHVHVIPRVSGDVADPRGGIRHVIPRTSSMLMRKTQQQVQFGTPRNLWEYVVLRGDLKKTQFLVSDRDTVRIRRKTLTIHLFGDDLVELNR